MQGKGAETLAELGVIPWHSREVEFLSFHS